MECNIKMFSLLKIAYYRLFYFFYSIENQSERKKEEPNLFIAVLAIIPLSFLLVALAFAMQVVVDHYMNSSAKVGIVFAITIWMIAIAFNYFVFLKKNRFQRVIKLFRNENNNTRIIRNVFCIAFSLLSLFCIDIVKTLLE